MRHRRLETRAPTRNGMRYTLMLDPKKPNRLLCGSSAGEQPARCAQVAYSPKDKLVITQFSQLRSSVFPVGSSRVYHHRVPDERLRVLRSKNPATRLDVSDDSAFSAL